MLNTYGYNRKTREEDEAIMRAVKCHHDTVAAKGYLVVMTSLVGSQNYDLDSQLSDIDTFSLILPPLGDLARAESAKAGLIFVEDGHCNFKDIRVALNLLRKASPNSVEYFASKYKIYNPVFESILHEYLDNNSKLWSMIHCNYKHMLHSIAGMAGQISSRNMPAGKKFSHALRLDNMYYHFMNSPNAGAVLEMRMGGDRDLAFMAKYDKNGLHDTEYNNQIERIADHLKTLYDEFTITEEQVRTQQLGLSLIDSLQWKLFKKYLMETNK